MIPFDKKKAWALLKDLSSRGKRPPGTREHKNAIQYLFQSMQVVCPKTWLQPFPLKLRGNKIHCSNICGLTEGKDPSSTICIGSHFDTRWIADREQDIKKKNMPIPGVNDGTSGVVIILELARILQLYKPEHNVLFILFDAEDIGKIDGYDFGYGAAYYAQHGEIIPDSVIALDMVGGTNMHLTIDLNSLSLDKSRQIFDRIFKIGRSFNYPCFFENPINLIISDHYPFLQRNIPACILIDINYPQWHTHSDTIEYCSEESLKYIGDVLFRYLVDIDDNLL